MMPQRVMDILRRGGRIPGTRLTAHPVQAVHRTQPAQAVTREWRRLHRLLASVGIRRSR